MSDYYTLITALPWLPDLQQCKQLPLSRIALDQRLTMLNEADRKQLELVEGLFHPNDRVLQGLTDKDVVSRWQAQLNDLLSDVLRERILFHMELRTLLAALRSREAGMENPALFFGIGRWLPRIRKHWFEPGFGLDEVCPQLHQLQRIVAKNDPMLLENKMNQWLWHDLVLCERQNHFSFEALACFVLRWGIAERHLQQNANLALEEFNRASELLLSSTGLELQMENH